jgi:hypothetical protein
MKTIIYVDGLNLYYGSLRSTPYKWLDLYALFATPIVEPGTDVELIRLSRSEQWKNSSQPTVNPPSTTRVWPVI